MTKERQPDKVLTLEPRSRKLRQDAAESDVVAAEEQQQGPVSVQEWFVRLEPAEQYQLLFEEEIKPMIIRPDTDFLKVANHASRQAKNAPDGSEQVQAAFSLNPGKDFQLRAKTLANGLAKARRQLRQSEHPGIRLTIERSLVEGQRRVQQQEDGNNAADAEDGSSSSAAAGSVETIMRPAYLLRMYSRLPRQQEAAAPAGSRRSRQPRSSRQPGSSSSSRRAGPRPGFVEVPESEWAALREQLEVVPHLTQQLQTMTRQHEQLLSLLAAQQQQQGDEQAAADAGQQ
jgi:hypothetical protein